MILNDSESVVFIGRPTNQSPVSFDHFILKRVLLLFGQDSFVGTLIKGLKLIVFRMGFKYH